MLFRFTYYMNMIASLEMRTKNGKHSVWNFFESADGFFYAVGGCHRPLVKKFETRKQLDALIQSHRGYGYSDLAPKQLELALA